jgi:hypothetical protein
MASTTLSAEIGRGFEQKTDTSPKNLPDGFTDFLTPT